MSRHPSLQLHATDRAGGCPSLVRSLTTPLPPRLPTLGPQACYTHSFGQTDAPCASGCTPTALPDLRTQRPACPSAKTRHGQDGRGGRVTGGRGRAGQPANEGASPSCAMVLSLLSSARLCAWSTGARACRKAGRKRSTASLWCFRLLSTRFRAALTSSAALPGASGSALLSTAVGRRWLPWQTCTPAHSDRGAVDSTAGGGTVGEHKTLSTGPRTSRGVTTPFFYG